jgi:hypothetical protein
MLTQTAIRTHSLSQPTAQPRSSQSRHGGAQPGTIELMGALMTFARNSEIYGENERT